MSSDLFAAFGSEPSTTANDKIGAQHESLHADDDLSTAWPENNGQAIVEQESIDVQQDSTISHDYGIDADDDFGDFECASASQVVDSGHLPVSALELEGSKSSKRASGLIPESFPPKASFKSPSETSKPKKDNAGSHPFAGRMDLLFEGGDDDYDAGADELGDLSSNPEAAMAYSKRIIAEQEAAQSKSQFSTLPLSNASTAKAPPKKNSASLSKVATDPDSGRRKLRKKSGYIPARDPQVLFDADNLSDHESEVDDFGDFEGGNGIEATIQNISGPKEFQGQQTMPAIDLLGLDDPPVLGGSVSNGVVDGVPSAMRASSEMTSSNNKREAGTTNTATEAFQVDDERWDDFEPFSTSDERSISDLRDSPNNSLQTPTIAKNTPSPFSTSLPPTNIPPPTLLLSLFPPLFTAADEALFDTMAKLDVKQRQMLLAHPASHQFLKGYLGHCRTLAHIVAGRKLRWRRDQHLSQSMRIGPAGATSKSGMKLTGLDKSEVAKEDREVLDTLRLWKAQVGKLRTAVTAASSAPLLPKLPSVPDIAEQMPVKTLKSSEGGIVALHPCALCGLKREERVGKVDVEIEDSFGEWWVQGTDMHVSCKNFWEEFERKLKGR